MSSLFLYCRPGFEGECAAEIQALAAARGTSGYCKAKPASAYVVFQPHDPRDAMHLHEQPPFGDLIFAHQWFVVLALCDDLPVTDRVTPSIEHLHELPGPISKFFLETPDTNHGKELAALCRVLERPVLRLVLSLHLVWQCMPSKQTGI